jgi:hypothetical protein
MDDRPRPTHELRGQLGTIGLSAAALESQPDLTETGRMALKRINEAVVRAEREIERIEKILELTH